MKITDFLSKDAVKVELQATGKEEVITELVEQLIPAKKIKKKIKEGIIQSLLERENLGSTGIGQGIAIPHAKSDKIKDVIVAFGISKKGVEFNALDGEPVYIIFLLIAPEESTGLHLKALAKISRLLKDKFFRQALREAKSSEEIINIIKEEETY